MQLDNTPVFITGGGSGLGAATARAMAARGARVAVFDLNAENAQAVAAEVKGVRYYSWAGSKAVTNILDPFDWLTTVVQAALYKEANDGINDTCTQRLGTVLGEPAWNHFDEVNQLAGLRGLFSPDPVSLYHAQVARLKREGL